MVQSHLYCPCLRDFECEFSIYCNSLLNFVRMFVTPLDVLCMEVEINKYSSIYVFKYIMCVCVCDIVCVCWFLYSVRVIY